MRLHVLAVRGSAPASGRAFACHGGNTSCLALGGRTFGYRVSDGRSSMAFLSDHGPGALGPGPEGSGPYHDAAMALARDADLLVHDAQHTAYELASRLHFGHSAADYAVRLGERAGARSVLLFHHDQARTDDDVDASVAGVR